MAERVLVAVAVAAIAATDGGYIALIRGQGGPPTDTPWVVPFVAGYLVLVAAVLAASLLVPAAAKPAMRVAASAGLLVLGVLAAFSIGLAVLIAAGLSIAAAVLAFRAKPGMSSAVSAAAAAVVALVVLVAGFQITWTHIVCPASGESGGTVASFVGVGSSYECNEGVLTYP